MVDPGIAAMGSECKLSAPTVCMFTAVLCGVQMPTWVPSARSRDRALLVVNPLEGVTI